MRILLVFFITVLISETIFLLELSFSTNNKSHISEDIKKVNTSPDIQIHTYEVQNSDYKNGKIFVVKIPKSKMIFQVSQNPSEFDFFVNANFFSDKPLGEVVINGRTVTPQKKGGGFFIVDGDNFNFVTNNRPKNISFSSQTHLVGISKGKLNHSIMFQNWSKLQTYRILLGKDKNGNFVLLHSDRYGLVSIREICEIGIKEGLIEALVFDGGNSVDVNLQHNLFNHSFSVIPRPIRSLNKDWNPPIYICGNFVN